MSKFTCMSGIFFSATSFNADFFFLKPSSSVMVGMFALRHSHMGRGAGSAAGTGRQGVYEERQGGGLAGAHGSSSSGTGSPRMRALR